MAFLVGLVAVGALGFTVGCWQSPLASMEAENEQLKAQVLDLQTKLATLELAKSGCLEAPACKIRFNVEEAQMDAKARIRVIINTETMPRGGGLAHDFGIPDVEGLLHTDGMGTGCAWIEMPFATDVFNLMRIANLSYVISIEKISS